MSATEVIYIDTDNLFKITGLKNEATSAYINNATCQLVKLMDSAGTTVSGSTAITLDYLAASDGVYQGAMPYTVTLTENAEYTAVVTATLGGARTTWRRTCRARYLNQ